MTIHTGSDSRGREFLTREITRGVVRIEHGLSNKITLGNLDAKRDWGFTVDYIRAM